jgi:multimeric flavodoxin WrbA
VATISDASGSQGLATTADLGTTTMQATSGAINGSTPLTVTAGFVLTGSLNTARASHTSTVLNNGMVLIAGGYNGNVLASAELYNPATGTFTPTGSLKTARLYHTATLLNNGRVLIVGGNAENGNILASAELYNPATGTFTPTGSLNTARELHTATMIQGAMINGMVLIAGGQGSGGALASAELYNPTTGTFAATGSLNTARLYHTATLLNNGTVLIAGGYDGNGNT